MHCIICERPIQADDQAVRHATVWRTSGNYGSRVYDSLTEGTYDFSASSQGWNLSHQQQRPALLAPITPIRPAQPPTPAQDRLLPGSF